MKKLIIIIISILLSIYSFSQTVNLKGKIINGDESPVSFASIYISKTPIGIIADEKGKFSFDIDSIHLHDTLIVSAIGYSPFKCEINNLLKKNNLVITLSDSLFLLDEVVALAYDNIKALHWTNAEKSKKKYLLTFATRNKSNVLNFITFIKNDFGKLKIKSNIVKWKGVKIGEHENLKVTIKFFKCAYCSDETNVNVTIEILDKKNKNLLDNEIDKESLRKFFQEVLNLTFEQGVDHNQLVRNGATYYLKESETPYTGLCYKYYDKHGQKGFKGEYKEGKKVGDWTYWYTNGQKKLEGSYVSGEKQGNWKNWYKNSQIRIDSNYNKGKLVGKNTWWHENGKKKKVAEYRDGKFLSKIEWDQTGKVTDKIDYDDIKK